MIFEKALIVFFHVFFYRRYRIKYKLPRSFRFNGYFIRIYGEGRIESGDDSYISFFSYLNVAKDTSITFGNNVYIGHNVSIYTSQIDAPLLAIEGIKDSIYGDVKVGNNVLIGTNSFICPDVTIGSNVVIAANSVVTRDVPDYSIAAGSPCVVRSTYAPNTK